MENEGRIYYQSFNTYLGDIWIGFTSKGLARLDFSINKEQFEKELTKNYRQIKEYTGKNSDYVDGIKMYLEKQIKSFDFPLDLKGTEFQRKVWQELLKIPYGEVKSYKDIALAIGSNKGFRAVGMANNRNPVAIVVPCHRVIGANGELVGYGGGIETKIKLLKLEGLNISERDSNGRKLYFVV
ncbi:methylated-DNA-[protein]-cysteine S-methyltransferase [Proteiniborus ethanoligenes]|uniref:Methylated-DNA--protein-cysteine methyltransferase n=1 Tax=Proteiniborus ethanoligenes TaxID=415015 RepID=A0A1H3S9Y8_9FIRM|nr:methylated-DNA--[protein]-cysteine S-methyltransferase [Proteiniborus ethanoligenes]SDZ34876.1 methylated-DNA-[protein]-cysteine S-methyltransferase [Proteiniborus ethanoligenes]